MPDLLTDTEWSWVRKAWDATADPELRGVILRLAQRLRTARRKARRLAYAAKAGQAR